MLHMFSVPLGGTSWLFGDNKSVVAGLALPHSTLNKHCNALSYHKVCEAVASGSIHFEHIPTTDNPADILTKPSLGIKLMFTWILLIFCCRLAPSERSDNLF